MSPTLIHSRRPDDHLDGSFCLEEGPTVDCTHANLPRVTCPECRAAVARTLALRRLTWPAGLAPSPKRDEFGLPGDYYLVKRTFYMRGGGPDRYALHDDPPRTNQSYEPREFGWCGTTNDVAVYGCGRVRVDADGHVSPYLELAEAEASATRPSPR